MHSGRFKRTLTTTNYEVVETKHTDPSAIDRENQGAPDFGRRRKRCSYKQATSTGWGSLQLNLRRSCLVSAWNVLMHRDNDHLPLLSRELGRLGISVSALSEVRKPRSGESSECGYTYYWSRSLHVCH